MLRHLKNLTPLIAVFVLTACSSFVAPAQLSALAAPPPQSTPSNSDIMALLAMGDYAGAIAAIEASSAREDEKLATTGRLALDGLVDPQAKTRPQLSIEEGIDRLERAALVANKVAVADLAATFNVGVNFRGKNVLLAARPELANCWNRVQAEEKKAADCVALRKTLGTPK